MNKNVLEIIGLFRSRHQVAQAAGMTSSSSVDGWVARGSIPHEKRLELLHNCEKFGVESHTLYGLLITDYFNILTGESDE
ncbi:MAG: hypothetical protein JKY52_08375 [Flavobacteriales bacterium]|nr:hypothetical protein [Flavobacteriales bacterium]